MRQLPVFERVVSLIRLNIASRYLHERQRGSRLLFHWDLIWIDFVPAERSPDDVIASVDGQEVIDIDVGWLTVSGYKSVVLLTILIEAQVCM